MTNRICRGQFQVVGGGRKPRITKSVSRRARLDRRHPPVEYLRLVEQQRLVRIRDVGSRWSERRRRGAFEMRYSWSGVQLGGCRRLAICLREQAPVPVRPCALATRQSRCRSAVPTPALPIPARPAVPGRFQGKRRFRHQLSDPFRQPSRAAAPPRSTLPWLKDFDAALGNPPASWSSCADRTVESRIRCARRPRRLSWIGLQLLDTLARQVVDFRLVRLQVADIVLGRAASPAVV